jgi:hypothetical protein
MNDERYLTMGNEREAPAGDSIEELLAAGKDRLKQWLRVGLDGFYLEGRSRWAFEPLALAVGRDLELSLDLSALYQRIPARQQPNWRQALAETIAELPADPKYVPALECLLDLARLMPAFEVLKILPARIGEGPFGLMRTASGQPVFDKVFLVAAELAAATDDARSCLQQLSTSSLFEPAYAGAAFIALCRVDPDNWPDHLTRMRPHLNAMLQQFNLDESAQLRYARDFVAAASADKIVAHLDIFQLDPMFRDPHSVDLWLWEGLFQGADAPLRARPSAPPDLPGSMPRPAFITRATEVAAIIQLKPEVQNAPIKRPPMYTMAVGPVMEAHGAAGHSAMLSENRKVAQRSAIEFRFFSIFGRSL